MIRSFVFRALTSTCLLASMATSQGAMVKSADKDTAAVRASIEAAIKLLQSEDLSDEDRAKALKKLEWAQKQLAAVKEAPIEVQGLDAGRYVTPQQLREKVKADADVERATAVTQAKAEERYREAVTKAMRAHAEARGAQEAAERERAVMVLDKAKAERQLVELEYIAKAKRAFAEAEKKMTDRQASELGAEHLARAKKFFAETERAMAEDEHERVAVVLDKVMHDKAMADRHAAELKAVARAHKVAEAGDGHVYEVVSPHPAAVDKGDEHTVWVRRKAPAGQVTVPDTQSSGTWHVLKADGDDDAEIRATIDDIRKELKEVRAMMQQLQRRLRDGDGPNTTTPSRRAMGAGQSVAPAPRVSGRAMRTPGPLRATAVGGTAPIAVVSSGAPASAAVEVAECVPAPTAPTAPSVPAPPAAAAAPSVPAPPAPTAPAAAVPPVAPAPSTTAPSAPAPMRVRRLREIH